jgi:L-alanine-DL-glutamate epimerase-like enolase superfamily enzyme
MVAEAVESATPMKVTRVEAVTFREDLRIGGGSGGADGAEFWWVRLVTDRGLVGTGETYPFRHAEVGALRDLAPLLLGQDPRDIAGAWTRLHHRLAMRNAGGAEMRVLSAVNMAQMDLLGQAAGLPLYRLLGGRTRDRVRVYNTTTDYWAINETKMGPDTLEIVDFLLERGITAMKIYPFEGGEALSAEKLDQGIGWIRDIRERAGRRMDICVDCWGGFDLPAAQRIARVLEPWDILYLEDAMLPASADAYARLAQETSVPICMSETLATRYEYREYLEAGACDVVMFDVSWVGGVWEALRISELAESYLVPTSPHTCGGPLLYLCSVHLCTAIPRLLIMESNYWKFAYQFPHFIENPPVPDQGHVRPPEEPGIGAAVRPELFESGDAKVETIARL